MPTGWSYRILHLDVGHLNQTLALTATALGLHTTFTAALRDEVLEQHLDIDPVTDLDVRAEVRAGEQREDAECADRGTGLEEVVARERH